MIGMNKKTWRWNLTFLAAFLSLQDAYITREGFFEGQGPGWLVARMKVNLEPHVITRVVTRSEATLFMSLLR